VADSAAIALALYERWQADLPGAMRMARNGRRLLEHPALRDDLPYCLEQDVSSAIPILQADGAVRLP
jgi:phosphosulfolactate phosphohydrolase-like enzyme